MYCPIDLTSVLLLLLWVFLDPSISIYCCVVLCCVVIISCSFDMLDKCYRNHIVIDAIVIICGGSCGCGCGCD